MKKYMWGFALTLVITSSTCFSMDSKSSTSKENSFFSSLKPSVATQVYLKDSTAGTMVSIAGGYLAYRFANWCSWKVPMPWDPLYSTLALGAGIASIALASSARYDLHQATLYNIGEATDREITNSLEQNTAWQVILRLTKEGAATQVKSVADRGCLKLIGALILQSFATVCFPGGFWLTSKVLGQNNFVVAALANHYAFKSLEVPLAWLLSSNQ